VGDHAHGEVQYPRKSRATSPTSLTKPAGEKRLDQQTRCTRGPALADQGRLERRLLVRRHGRRSREQSWALFTPTTTTSPSSPPGRSYEGHVRQLPSTTREGLTRGRKIQPYPP
jgi:hypothetical protein